MSEKPGQCPPVLILQHGVLILDRSQSILTNSGCPGNLDRLGGLVFWGPSVHIVI